jgi:hypothetical protein
MSNSSKNNKRDNYLHSSSHTTQSHTPITRAPVYSPQQTPSMWENIKMGFGVSMGNRIFNGIFGEPSVKVKVDQMPAPAPATEPAPATRYNKCDYLKDEIKLHKCDNEEMNSNKCDDLFRQMYKCQHNM